MAQQDINVCQHQSLFAVIEGSLTLIWNSLELYAAMENTNETHIFSENTQRELDKVKKKLEKIMLIRKKSAIMSAPTSSSPTYPALSLPLHCSHSGNVSHETQPHTSASPTGKQYIDTN